MFYSSLRIPEQINLSPAETFPFFLSLSIVLLSCFIQQLFVYVQVNKSCTTVKDRVRLPQINLRRCNRPNSNHQKIIIITQIIALG